MKWRDIRAEVAVAVRALARNVVVRILVAALAALGAADQASDDPVIPVAAALSGSRS